MSEFAIYAWIGEDERGGGKIGIKMEQTPAGYVPLAAMSYHLDRLAKLAPGMEKQAQASGMKIRLMKFVSTGEIAAETKAGKWRDGDGAAASATADFEESMGKLAIAAREDIIPKMKASRFCMLAMDGPDDVDIYLALQLGLAISLDLPLVVVATRNAPVGARLRQLADVIVEGESIHDPDLRERLGAAVNDLMRKRATVQ
jgi:hypothetical protein